QFFLGNLERLLRPQVVVKLFQGGEETRAFLFPRQRQRILPLAAAFGHGQAPIHQIANVRQNSCRSARSFGHSIFGKARSSIADRLCPAISKSSKSVAQQRAGVAHGRHSSLFVFNRRKLHIVIPIGLSCHPSYASPIACAKTGRGWCPTFSL